MSPIIPLNHKFKTNSSQRVTPLTEVRANFCVFSRQFSEQKTNKSLVQSCWGKILQVFLYSRWRKCTINQHIQSSLWKNFNQFEIYPYDSLPSALLVAGNYLEIAAACLNLG